MKRISLSVIMVILLIAMIPSLSFAVSTFSEALSKTSTSNLPFNLSKRFKIPSGSKSGGYFIYPNDTVPDRIFTNVQLTNFERASTDPASGAILLLKFIIPNSNMFLIVVSFGNFYGGDETITLSVVNSDGIITSSLLASVTGIDAYVKQCRIISQNQIIVTTIMPYVTTSIPFDNLTSFNGHRRDITYSINDQGQFVQTSVQNYYGKTYPRAYLEDLSINLWDGGEMPY